MSATSLRDILAREIMVTIHDYERSDWYLSPERRRDYYRTKADELIESLAASGIAIIRRPGADSALAAAAEILATKRDDPA